MSHIFISYSKQNRDYARKLTDKLRAEGFEVWIDDRIDYGETWERVIFGAIDECSAFLVIMTPDSYASDWVLRECQYADRRKKAQFPVLLDGEEFPRYISTQYCDVRGAVMPPEEFYVRLESVVPKRLTSAHDSISPSQSSHHRSTDMPAAKPATSGPGTGMSDEKAARFAKLKAVQTQNLGVQGVFVSPDVSSILPPPFEWCEIPAGKVTIEYSETDHKTFDVPAFAMAKYPITNSQYQVFVDAEDGFRDRQWWDYSEDARAWRQSYGKSAETVFEGDGDDLPRTKVSWFEAVAFCQWLTFKLGIGQKRTFSTGELVTPSILASVQEIALPTERQWQRAAQGEDGRDYPWGDGFDKTRCNTKESGKGRPTPVTDYPGGASPFGVMDMSGNVWEWCSTRWHEDSSDLSGDMERVLRGGSFFYERYFSRGAFRDYGYPGDRDYGFGFRVVCRPPSP